MRSKAEMVAELKGMLHDMFEARAGGTLHPRLARTQGYVDGYMRALLDAGHVTKQELLEMVAGERAFVSGPATREMAAEAADEIIAA